MYATRPVQRRGPRVAPLEDAVGRGSRPAPVEDPPVRNRRAGFGGREEAASHEPMQLAHELRVLYARLGRDSVGVGHGHACCHPSHEHAAYGPQIRGSKGRVLRITVPIEPSSRQVVGAAVTEPPRRPSAGLSWSLVREPVLSQSEVSRVECGLLVELTIETSERLLGAMGARLVVSVDAPYLRRPPAPARSGARALFRARRGRLRRAGWEVATPRRKSAAAVRVDGSMCWLGIPRQVVARDRDQDGDPRPRRDRALARAGTNARHGWPTATRVAGGDAGRLLLLASEANDVRVTSNRAPFASGFPMRVAGVDRLCVNVVAEPGQPGRALAMIDPLSWRASWVRALRSTGSGRRPVRDSRAFMRERPAGARGRQRPTPPDRPDRPGSRRRSVEPARDRCQGAIRVRCRARLERVTRCIRSWEPASPRWRAAEHDRWRRRHVTGRSDGCIPGQAPGRRREPAAALRAPSGRRSGSGGGAGTRRGRGAGRGRPCGRAG